MIKSLLYTIGAATFEVPLVMSVLFAIYYALLGTVAFRRPVAGVIIYYGTAIMNPQFYYPGFTSLPMAKISAGICLLACLIHLGTHRPRLTVVHLFAGVFVLFSILCTLGAIDPMLSQRRFNEFNNIGIMLVLVAWAVKSREDIDWIFWGVLGSFWFGVLQNLVETQTRGAWHSVKGTGGWLGDSNDWALALAMAIPLFYGSCFHPKVNTWWKRTFMILTLISVLLVLTITSSRGAFLAAGASFGALMLTEQKRMRAVAAMGVVLVVVAFYMPDSYVSQITSIFDLKDSVSEQWAGEAEQGGKYTGAERVYFWRVAYTIMQDNPFDGIGWGNFVNEFALREGLDKGAVAHSSWFQVMAECGAIGFTAYVAMFIYSIFSLLATLRQARKAGDELLVLHTRMVGAGLTAFILGASFVSRENSELAFLYVGMAAAMAQMVPVANPIASAVSSGVDGAASVKATEEPKYVRKQKKGWSSGGSHSVSGKNHGIAGTARSSRYIRKSKVKGSTYILSDSLPERAVREEAHTHSNTVARGVTDGIVDAGVNNEEGGRDEERVALNPVNNHEATVLDSASQADSQSERKVRKERYVVRKDSAPRYTVNEKKNRRS